jgi:4'-phosphopantetheinyl transferase
LAVGTDDAPEVLVTDLRLGTAGVRACAALLSEAERRRAERFAFARDARRFIVGRARLRQLLASRTGLRPEAVELIAGAHGKPALADPGTCGALRFNLSRHEEIAVCALAQGREVGIDVEAIRPIPDAEALVAHWFTRGEQEVYHALAPGDRPLGFFNGWTRKEAFVKASGEGLTRPLDSFEVSLAPEAPARLLKVESPSGDARTWSLASFSPAPGHVAAVVAEVS